MQLKHAAHLLPTGQRVQRHGRTSWEGLRLHLRHGGQAGRGRHGALGQPHHNRRSDSRGLHGHRQARRGRPGALVQRTRVITECLKKITGMLQGPGALFAAVDAGDSGSSGHGLWAHAASDAGKCRTAFKPIAFIVKPARRMTHVHARLTRLAPVGGACRVGCALDLHLQQPDCSCAVPHTGSHADCLQSVA